MPILLSHSSGAVERASASDFLSENEMQRFLTDLPGIIPIDEITEGAQLLVLAREFSTASGPIDAVGIDQDGRVYIIEAKLSRNADRRKVVAQALDYGAALWHAGVDPDDVVARLDRASGGIRESIQSAFGLPDDSVDGVLNSVRANVRSGTFRFVIVMDQLDQRLKTLINYVNQSSDFGLFGVELELFHLQDVDVVIPKLHGAEARKPSRPSTGTRVWTEESFFPAIAAEHGQTAEQVGRALYTWGETVGRIEWQAGKMHGGFSVVVTVDDSSIDLFKVSEDGRVRTYSRRFAGLFGEQQERWDALRERLGSVGLDLPDDPQQVRKLSVAFMDAGAAWASQFTDAFGWVVAELRALDASR